MTTPSYEDIYRLHDDVNDKGFYHWYYDDLFALTWWVLFFATIVPYFIWWRIVDRKRLMEMTSFGLFSATLASFLDVIGVTIGLWGYPDKLIPVLPPLLPADLVIIPVSSMLIYQYTTKWSSYILFYLLFSLLLAFIVEPIFSYYDMYIAHKWWTHTYSFFGLVLYGCSLRVFIKFIRANHSF
ncbi:CBO0543 family protein [Metabacillus sp. HB246100]